jgi:hypothetical protein
MMPGADDILALLPVDDLSADVPPGREARWVAGQLGCPAATMRAALERLELAGKAQRSKTGRGPWLWARCPGVHAADCYYAGQPEHPGRTCNGVITGEPPP